MEAIVVKPANREALLFLKKLLSKLTSSTVTSVEIVDLKELIPNTETIKAIQDANERKGTKAKKVSDLMKKLNS
ncbi:MAG: hypothetical protein HGB12_15465 [Bacteroidetes bacterium]|nr:hypothetical protein [Bacteroidota bacterium]